MQQATPTTNSIPLFRHSKRPQWGVAAFLWERDTKRGYQFSDGKVRVFKEGFFHLFEQAEAPGDGSAKAVRRAARIARADSVVRGKRLPTLRDQITMFRRNYPEGFVGEKWTKKYRGKGARKRLKRHRDAALADAFALRPAELKPVIEERDWNMVYERLLEVATNSSLVTASHVKKLKKVGPSQELAMAIYNWLCCEDLDDDETRRCFNKLVRHLGIAATWPIVSALGALVHPKRHTCVRPSVFKQQGTMLINEFSVKRRPSFKTYKRYVEVAQTVFSDLEDAGLQPRDLLDVYDFIWETLRPAAREELLAQYELPPLPEVAGESDADADDDNPPVDLGAKQAEKAEKAKQAAAQVEETGDDSDDDEVAEAA